MNCKKKLLKILLQNKYKINSYNINILDKISLIKIIDNGCFITDSYIFKKLFKDYVLFEFNLDINYIKIIENNIKSIKQIFIIEKKILNKIIEKFKNSKIQNLIILIEKNWDWFKDLQSKTKVFEFLKINSKFLYFFKNDNLNSLKDQNVYILLKGKLEVQKEYNKIYDKIDKYTKEDYINIFFREDKIKNSKMKIIEIIDTNLIKEENMINKSNILTYKVKSTNVEIFEIDLQNLNSYFNCFKNSIETNVKNNLKFKINNRYEYFYNEIKFKNKIIKNKIIINCNNKLKLKLIPTYKYFEIIKFHKERVKNKNINFERNKTEKSIKSKIKKLNYKSFILKNNIKSTKFKIIKTNNNTKMKLLKIIDNNFYLNFINHINK